MRDNKNEYETNNDIQDISSEENSELFSPAEDFVEQNQDIPFAVEEDLISAQAEEENSDKPAENKKTKYNSIDDIDVPFATDENVLNEIEAEYIRQTGDGYIGEGEEMTKGKKKKKKMSKKKKAVVIISCILGFFVIAGIVLYCLGIENVKKFVNDMRISENDPVYDYIDKIDASSIEAIEKLDSVNILLLGVDKDGERSDSVMLVNYNIKTNEIKLLSIPRDTRIYVEDRKKMRKLTEVHAMHDSSGDIYGAAAVLQAVENLTGMKINYYMEFSFEALDGIMEQLGPVKFDVPDLEGKGRGMNYDDPYQDLHIHLKPGMQELSGNQIQQFLRYRKSNYKDAQNVNGSDLQRVERQQELLGAIIDQKLNASVITKTSGILDTVKKNLRTTFSGDEVLAYSGFLLKDDRYKNISSENMSSFVLPGEDKMVNGVSYYLSDEDATAEMVREEFGFDVESKNLSSSIRLDGKKGSGSVAASTENKDNENKKSSTSKDDKSSSTSKSKNKEESYDEERTGTTTKSDEEEYEEMKRQENAKKKNTSQTKKETSKNNNTSSNTSSQKTEDNSNNQKTETNVSKENNSLSQQKESENSSSQSREENKETQKPNAEKEEQTGGESSKDTSGSASSTKSEDVTEEKVVIDD